MNEAIPYTSHNSSACVVIDCPDLFPIDRLIEKAVTHIEAHFITGSDPGLCVCPEYHPALERLIPFGLQCATTVVTQEEAFEAAKGIHLSGHGGTNDGIIGAAAGVGLTAHGWHGRFIEYGRLRDFPMPVSVEKLEQVGIQVISIDRDAPVPLGGDAVETHGWLRPRLIGGKPTVPVTSIRKNLWGTVGGKRPKQKKEGTHGWKNFLQGENQSWRG